MKKVAIFLAFAICVAACSSSGEDTSAGSAPIYPDYKDITIPYNIAPLNFMLTEKASRIRVTVDGQDMICRRGSKAIFSEKRWKDIMFQSAGDTLEVKVSAKVGGNWKEYDSFVWEVSEDRIDSCITYRLIEPDYEAYNNIVLQQRCVEDFSTDDFSDFRVIGNRCMNCHAYAWQDPDTSMFYVRGKDGGAILNLSGKLQKLSIKGDGMISGSVYFGFSPDKRYIVFSSNKIIPGYHTDAARRMEVFDTMSDVYVADLERKEFIGSGCLSRPVMLETFPTFSPDGKYIYYCSAPKMDTVTLSNIEKVKYSLYRVSFDQATGIIGDVPEIIYDAYSEGHSVCHPKISPDGRFICFSIADFGTFPLWHREADLLLMNLENGVTITMEKANSRNSDTYHSWSSNSRWLVFASKRDDGVYGRPYFTHITSDGICSKAFVLPQKQPLFYDNLLKSYNAPEFGKGKLPFDSYDVRKALEEDPDSFGGVKFPSRELYYSQNEDK